MTEIVDREFYSRFQEFTRSSGLHKFASFRRRFSQTLLPCLGVYYELADLSDEMFRELHTLCTSYSGSRLVEDREGYFYWSLNGKEPCWYEYRLYVSRLFVDLANALGELFWRDGVYRVIDVILEPAPLCYAEEQSTILDFESVKDDVLEIPLSVSVVDETEVSLPVVTTESTESGDTDTTPRPCVEACTVPTVTRVMKRKWRSQRPKVVWFTRFQASVFRADGSDEVKARWRKLYALIHAKPGVTTDDEYAYHLYKTFNIRLRSGSG